MQKETPVPIIDETQAKFIRLSKWLNTIFLAIIVLGLILVGAYVAVKASSDPVEYKSLVLDKDSYVTGEEFTYKSEFCRNAGKEVAGQVTRVFVPVEQKNGKWVPIEGRAATPLFSSTNVTNDPGCATATRTTLIPFMPTGDYQMRMTGNYTVLSILPPSVDTINSQTVRITQNPDGPLSTEELNEKGAFSSDSIINPTQDTFARSETNTAPGQGPVGGGSTSNTTTNNTTTNNNNTTNNNTQPEEPILDVNLLDIVKLKL